MTNPGRCEDEPDRGKLGLLSLAALSIVFGDIGTSPLYAFRESFLVTPNLQTSPSHVLGVLSLIVWAVTIVISIKYLAVVMRPTTTWAVEAGCARRDISIITQGRICRCSGAILEPTRDSAPQFKPDRRTNSQ